MPKGKPWTVELENQLRELLQAGKSVKVVAKVLGKTENAIRQKMIKLGLVEEKRLKITRFFLLLWCCLRICRALKRLF